jgi:hypothetical protein
MLNRRQFAHDFHRNIPKLLLKELRWLDTQVDPDALSTKLGELLGLVPLFAKVKS